MAQWFIDPSTPDLAGMFTSRFGTVGLSVSTDPDNGDIPAIHLTKSGTGISFASFDPAGNVGGSLEILLRMRDTSIASNQGGGAFLRGDTSGNGY